jgi:lysophospholipase L1-like esterase
MATNWNAVLANINNASDILAILRKVLGLLDGKVDLTKIDEIIADISNMQTNVDTALTNVNSALSEFDTEAQEAIQQVIAAGLMEGFTTEAELLATRPLEPKKYAKAEDTDVIWFWNKPDGSPSGSYWTSTGLSEYNRAINFVNANPLFKPIKIVAGDDFNNFTKQGIYYHWGANLSSTQVVNGPLYVGGNLAQGVLIVYNPDSAGAKSSGLTHIFYPYTDGYAPFFRKVLQSSGNFPTTWDSYVLQSTQFSTMTALTTGQDVLALPVGRYNIPLITIGNSLLNMPTMPLKFGKVEVGYTANSGYKEVRITPYGQDKAFYVNKQYESGVWHGWITFKDAATLKAENDLLYTAKTELASAIAGALNNISQDKYFGKQFTASELTGSVLWNTSPYVGYNNNSGAGGVNFNYIKANMWCTTAEPIQYRVYYGAKVQTDFRGGSVLQANVNSPDYSGLCKNFPTADSGAAQEIQLDQVISIPPNTPFVIVFRSETIKIINLRYFGTATGNLESRGFNISSSTADWGAAGISVTSIPNPPTTPTAFVSAGFQLLFKLLNSGGGTPQPTFTPKLVLPPKIYALEGLQSNIFLPHTIGIDHTLYDYDFTCTKGAHQVSGWRWTPASTDAAGTYALTLACLDKRTGDVLATASTQVILVAKTANAGNTKKIQVIGDSLVAAGSITQGILNNASADSMAVTLIGTRGTGLNKHEGRGGWTINDYTTAGRTYYLFTVSGITTAPAINATIYTYNGGEFTIQESNLSGGAGTLLCSYTGTAPVNGSTGTLTKKDAAAVGDTSISFSNVQSQSGNPFWNGTAIDYQNYLTVYGLTAPDVVIIQLGINDTFGLTSDQAVTDFCATAFPKLDLLINSILAVNANIKVAVCAPPSYASQDAFGNNYLNGQTSRRACKNITAFNDALFAYYKPKEANRIYTLSGGINVDSANNFPEASVAVNSRNTKTVIKQTNGVHPDTGGYYEEADAITPLIKLIA